ncbi:YchJ family protein [Chitinilyticum litopenaei]|uniref:YchJ family protein n=1 Tax=Chitinilyticum litopenaei TaxID=1121276 RepID=UPI000419DFB9|nr:YchJ family metal-binding protein [Chitinilyticum litopenaei]
MARKSSPNFQPDTCPCGSGLALSACCGRYHAGQPAPDPERLMRSRYTAYVLGLEDYLLATWHASTRPACLGLTDEPRAHWLGLTVKQAGQDGEQGSVAFVARYKVGGRAYRMEEHSRFVREAGCWFYLDGEISD